MRSATSRNSYGPRQSISVDAKAAKTSTQLAALTRRRTALLKDVQKFQQTQAFYMPGLIRYQKELAIPPVDPSPEPESISLFLPSSIPSNHRETICIADVHCIETKLREAQCSEAIADLRTQLIKRTYVNKYKERTASSQRAYTRFRTLQDHIEVKIKAAEVLYNTARAALYSLKGPGLWEEVYQVLNREDVRGMHERAMTAEEKEEHAQTRRMAGFTDEQIDGELDGAPNMPTVQFDPVLALGEGSRQLSWIWYTISDQERQSGEVDGCRWLPIMCAPRAESQHLADLRVEWLKCRARAQRWNEELNLLEEEMRRCLVYCRWKGVWWSQQIERLSDVNPLLAEGLVAYAAQQLSFENRRADIWERKWSSIRARALFIKHTHLEESYVNRGTESTAPLIELEIELDEDEEHEFGDDNDDDMDDT